MTIQSPLNDGLYIRPIRPNRRWIRYFVKNYHYIVGIMLNLIVVFSLFSVEIDFAVKVVLILSFVGVYWFYFIGRTLLRKNKRFGRYYQHNYFQAVRILSLIVFITGYLFFIYSKTSYLEKVHTDTLWLLYFPIITAISHRGSRTIFIITLILIVFCLLYVHTIPITNNGIPPLQVGWEFLVKALWITFLSGTSYILLRYMSDTVADLNLIINVQNRMRRMEGTLLRSKVQLDENNYLEKAVEIIKDDLFFDHVNIFRLDQYNQKLICAAGACEGGKKLAQTKYKLNVNEASINGYVITSKEAYVSNDVKEDPHYLPHDAFPNTRSELVVPIMVRNRLYGVLDIQVHKLDYFLEQDQTAINILANHIGWVIDNSEQYEHISWINRIVETIADPIFTQNHLDETLQEIADSAQKELDVDLVFLYSLNPKVADGLSGPIYSGVLMHPEIMDVCPNDPDSIVYRVISYDDQMIVNESIDSNELDKHPLFQPSKSHQLTGRPPFIQREGIKANVIIRLMSNGQCVGMLFLNFRRTRTFSDWDKKRYQLFAHLAALAIQKMQFQQNVIKSELNDLANWIHDSLVSDALGVFKILRSINISSEKIGCAEARKKINSALDAVEHLNNDIRYFNRLLKDNPYDNLMLELDKMKMLFEQVFKVKTIINWIGDVNNIPPELSKELFLVIREALNNALRHGKAKNIVIAGTVKGNSISAIITDDGTGFDPSQVKRMNGLLSMKYRIEELNGIYKLSSNPGRGTRISLQVPLKVLIEGAS